MVILDSKTERLREKTAIALGFFDGLHMGHRAVINSILDEGYSPAVFTFESSNPLPKFQKRENILTQKVKETFLDEMGVKYLYSAEFDEVKGMSGGEFVKEILIGKMNGAKISCGYDFHFGKGGKWDAKDLKAICNDLGVEAEIIPEQKIGEQRISSTIIRQMLKNGEITFANELLGQPLTYILEVVHGHKVGRELNFPTINQYIPCSCILPKQGVYSSATFLDGKKYLSISSIGNRPTFGGDDRAMLETNILGFKGDLYGQKIRVELRRFLREQIKFDNRKELIEQMELDKANVINNSNF